MPQTRDTADAPFDAHTLGAWTFNPARRELLHGGTLHTLEPRTSAVLSVLLQRRGEYVSVADLLGAVWHDSDAGADSVYRAITALRKILRDDVQQTLRIESAPRIGYRLRVVSTPSVPRAPAMSAAVAAPAAVPARPAGSTRRVDPTWRLLIAAAAVIAVLALVAFVLWPRIAQLFAASRPTVAVLRFADAGDDVSRTIDDGVAEDLIDQLSADPTIRVVAGASSLQFESGHADPVRTGRTLQVAALVEGTVTLEGSARVLSLRLHDLQHGTTLWSGHFRSDAADPFHQDGNIAAAIASALHVPPPPREDAHIPPVAARLQYLRGERADRRTDIIGWNTAIADYSQAIELDPEYAAAYAARAHAESYLYDIGVGKDYLRRAEEDASRAIALDPRDSRGWAERGYLRFSFELDFESAAVDLDRAMSLSPPSTIGFDTYSQYLATYNRMPEAIAIARRVTELSPLYVEGWRNLGGLYNDLGWYRDAAHAYETALQIEPTSVYTLYDAAANLLAQGRAADALAEYRRITTNDALRTIGEVFALHALGNDPEARIKLAQMDRYGDDYAYNIAQGWGWIGEPVAAQRWLDRSLAQNDPGLIYLRREYLSGPLRALPGYPSVMARLRLPVSKR